MHRLFGLWRNSHIRNVLGLIVAVLSFAGASPSTPVALAATTTSANAQNAVSPGARLQAEIKLLDRYVITNANGTLALSPPASVVRHVNAADLAILRSGLTTVNAKIEAGELQSTSDHRLVDAKATTFNIQWNWTGRTYHWWGIQDWFSEYWTLKIEAAYNMGAAAAGICAVVAAALGVAPVGIACGVAAGVLAFGAAWMAWADNGGGVVISQTWTPFPFGGIWISGQ